MPACVKGRWCHFLKVMLLAVLRRGHIRKQRQACFYYIGLGQRWCISYAFAVVEVGWQTGRVVNEADRAVGGEYWAARMAQSEGSDSAVMVIRHLLIAERR